MYLLFNWISERVLLLHTTPHGRALPWMKPKKPSRVFARGLGNAVPFFSPMSPEVHGCVLTANLKGPRLKKKDGIYMQGIGEIVIPDRVDRRISRADILIILRRD